MIRLFAGLVVLSSVIATANAAWVKIDDRDAHPTRVLVRYKNKAEFAQLGGVANVAVRTRYSEIPNLALIEIKEQGAVKAAAVGPNPDPTATLKKVIRDLEATGLFTYVSPDYVGKFNLAPTDKAFVDGTLWGLRNTGQSGGAVGADMNAVPAWSLTTGNTNFIVAVMDSGANMTHRDLVAQFWRNPGEIPGNGLDDDGNGFVDDVNGINGVLDSGDPSDTSVGHGTHVAGTIGAGANDGFDHVGVIWDVQLMIIKIGDDSGVFSSAAIQGINYALSFNVKISNHSWGGYGQNQPLFDAMSAARDRGHLFVCAAGNDGLDLDTFPLTNYPAGFDLDNIISVAAIDRNDQLAFFSNYGKRQVDVGAPGLEIFSCWIGSDTAYNSIAGTSMASPHVCGAAALLWSSDETLDYTRIRDRIINRGTKTPGLTGKVASDARVNMFNTLAGQVDGQLEVSTIPPSGGILPAGGMTNITVKVTDDFNVNNATVSGQFNGINVSFLNNGIAPDANPGDGLYTATITMPNQPGSYTLSLSVTAPGKVSTNFTARFDVVPRAPNDNFSGAEKIPVGGGIFGADNRFATSEALEPIHADVSKARSLWWSWSTPSAAAVIVDTAGTSFDDDAVLAVYTGSSLPSLSLVAAAEASTNGPAGTRAPYVKFTAEPNITYWMAVAQSGLGTNSPGRVALRLEKNGDIDVTRPTARVTNMLSGVFIRSTTNTIILSGDASDPLPNASGVAVVKIKANIEQQFTDVSGTTNWTSQPLQLTNGWNTFELTAFDRADNQAPVTQFSVFYAPQSLNNDLFGNADTNSMRSLSAAITTSNTNATKEFGEPNHAGNEGGHSLWWTFMPPSDGILLVSTEGSSFDTLLAVYTVNDPVVDRAVSSVILVEANDDSEDSTTHASEVNPTLQAGKLYYIAVDGYAGRNGTVKLTFNFAAIPVVTLTASAGPGGSMLPASGDFPVNSAVTVRAVPDRYQQFNRFEFNGSGEAAVVNRNPYTFTITGDTTVAAFFEAKVFTDDFESGTLTKLSYQNTSDFWTTASVVTNSATGAASTVARTISALPDGRTAALVLTTNLLGGEGSFEFSINTEPDFDKFQFLVDGVVRETWSGSIPWTLYTFQIPAKEGTTTLEWRYTKDLAVTAVNELVAIDNLELQIAPPPAPIDAFLSLSSNPPKLTVTGTPNGDYRLETSTDFTNWTPAPGVNEQTANEAGVATFNLPAMSSTTRFYRVVAL